MGQFKPLQMPPHTAAKHMLLKKYLDPWFPILGKYNSRINYVDGFAGPGEYEDGAKGSPIIALESAMTHVEQGTLGSNVNVNFIFVERNTEHAGNLGNMLSQLELPPKFRVSLIEGEFADKFGSILDALETDDKSLAPTFAFVDPFGFSGIPFELMKRILGYSRCEVFINIMVEFINRFLKHPDESVVAHFPKTFGTEEVLEIPNRPGDRVQQLLHLYRSQLEDAADFVGRFDMHGRKDQKTYSLFFASNSPHGFQKMKEAMWSVDRVSGSKFSDADPHASQKDLFESLGFDCLWDEMLAEFRGQQVSMVKVLQFVIEKTDYLPKHARELLKRHEKEGDICVIAASGYKRRVGTFKEDKVEILFASNRK